MEIRDGTAKNKDTDICADHTKGSARQVMQLAWNFTKDNYYKGKKKDGNEKMQNECMHFAYVRAHGTTKCLYYYLLFFTALYNVIS